MKISGIFYALLLTLGSSAVLLPNAQAGEARVGVVKHDVKVFGLGGARGKEKSEAISLEYIFDQPSWLEWSRARPYVGGSVNLSGNTSHGGAGLNWQTENFFDKAFFEVELGVVGHSGSVRVPNPADATTQAEIDERFNRKNTEIEFGSKVLFRTQFALGWEFSDDYAADIFIEHLSHGQILGGPENEGLDSVGVRLARRF